MEQQRTRNSGFASMDANKQKEIARKGGMAAHRKGTAHEFTSEEARAAGRKGGERSAERRRTTAGSSSTGHPAGTAESTGESNNPDVVAAMSEPGQEA